MHCKNCETPLTAEDRFCSNCGGKVIHKRLTLNDLLVESIEKVFGWDNKFMLTLRTLLIRPEKVIHSFINGVRGKYMNPFSIFAFVVAVSVFVMTVFQAEIMELGKGLLDYIPDSNPAKKMNMNWMFSYTSIISFLNLPIYAVLSYFVFRKPYNLGEHLVISVYAVTISTLLSTLFMLISILINSPILYLLSSYLSLILSFIFVYQSVYKLKPFQLIWKIIKFLLIIMIPFVGLVLLGYIFSFFLDMMKG